MAGGATPSEIIVVHTGKIIVHERVRVDTFKRAREWKRVVDLTPTSFRRGETKNRPQPFPASKQTVAHRPVNRRRLDIRPRQIPIQRAVDQFLASAEMAFEIHVTKTAAELLNS